MGRFVRSRAARWGAVIGIVTAAAIVIARGDLPFAEGDPEPWATSAWAGSEPVENQPLVVVLCHGSNQTWPANLDAAYFEAQFRETGGSWTIADYWRDISHGRFSIDGTLVVDVQLDVPRDEIGDRSDDDWEKCRDGLNDQHDIEWDRYDGPVVVKPQTLGTIVDAIDETATEIRVRTESPSAPEDWSTPPFDAVLTTSGSLWGSGSTVFENVRVTALARDGDIVTFTVERGQTGGYKDRATSASPFPADTQIRDVSEIVGSLGQLSISAHMDPATFNHELGHFFGWPHSRLLSTPTTDYGDCFDVMSARSCFSTHYFDLSLEYAGRPEVLTHGLGMTSGYLDRRGWIADEDRLDIPCGGPITSELKALGLPGEGYHQLRVRLGGGIGAGVSSEYVTVELRSRRFAWDRGIPADAVVLHHVGTDGYAYLIDNAPGGLDGMVAGDGFELAGWTIAVDSVDGRGGAVVTVVPPESRGADECVSGGTASEPEVGPSSSSTTTTTTTTTTTEAPVLEGVDCVPGTWQLESQAYIDELARASGAGIDAMQWAGGPYTMWVEPDGSYTARRDGWSLQFSSPEGTITMVFDSDEAGTLAWDDVTMTFAETDTTSPLDITMIIESGGEREVIAMSSLPAAVISQMPAPELMSGAAAYTCVEDTFVVVDGASGVSATWTRVR